MLRHFYDSLGIGRKQIVFSDSLNVDLCLEYKKIAEEAGFTPSFGVGTFLTSVFFIFPRWPCIYSSLSSFVPLSH